MRSLGQWEHSSPEPVAEVTGDNKASAVCGLEEPVWTRARQCRRWTRELVRTTGEAVWHAGKASARSRPGSRGRRRRKETVLQEPVHTGWASVATAARESGQTTGERRGLWPKKWA